MAWKPEVKEPAMIAAIREAIRDSGLTISEISRRSGVSHPQISRFIHGERTMTLPAAARVCAVVGLELIRRKRPTAGRTPTRSSTPEQSKRKAKGKVK